MKKNVGERVMDQMAEMYQKNWENLNFAWKLH